MSSQIISVTIQAAFFSALSTTVAQGITAWQKQRFSFDPSPFINFMIIAIIVTPPNYLYQRFLEDTFPAKIPIAHPKKSDDKTPGSENERLSKTNTTAKFFLDQSIGAAANTLMFIFLIGMLKGKSISQVGLDVQKDFWPMITAGWRVFPAVTLLNLLVIPFDYRPLVGNTVGLVWGVYVALNTI